MLQIIFQDVIGEIHAKNKKQKQKQKKPDPFNKTFF